MDTSAADVIKRAADKWPTSFVARSKTKEFTGGVYSSGYLANCDSEGSGPEGAFKIRRQVCYPVDKFCEWLVARLAAQDHRKTPILVSASTQPVVKNDGERTIIKDSYHVKPSPLKKIPNLGVRNG